MGRITATTTSSEPSNGRPRRGNSHDVDRGPFVQLRPQTHDISLAGKHVPSIEKVAADLEAAVKAVWPRRHHITYSKVHVLLLSWEDDDLGVHTEVKDIHHVFADMYQYKVEAYEIPSSTPNRALNGRVHKFLEYDGHDTLLIVYYAGHAKRNQHSNDPPIWVASRSPTSAALPSAGIQSLFEEAIADTLLLFDCCNSAATSTIEAKEDHTGVTEVIAACGYESVAAEVDEHSFSKALTEILAIASKGRPISVGDLHARVLARLKCWTPCLVKDNQGRFLENDQGRLCYEHQRRRTPVHTVLCETKPRRSIILAPLLITDNLRQRLSLEQMADIPSQESKKRKRVEDDVPIYPQILISVRVENTELDRRSWLDCMRLLPPEAKDIKIEGMYKSFSTLLILRLPAAVWNLLPENLAYSFIGFVTSENMATSVPDAVTSVRRLKSSEKSEGEATMFPDKEPKEGGSAFRGSLVAIPLRPITPVIESVQPSSPKSSIESEKLGNALDPHAIRKGRVNNPPTSNYGGKYTKDPDSKSSSTDLPSTGSQTVVIHQERDKMGDVRCWPYPELPMINQKMSKKEAAISMESSKPPSRDFVSTPLSIASVLAKSKSSRSDLSSNQSVKSFATSPFHPTTKTTALSISESKNLSDARSKDDSQMIISQNRAELLINFIKKAPGDERGISMYSILKWYHSERNTLGMSVDMWQEEKELWRNLRMKKNERDEIVFFSA